MTTYLLSFKYLNSIQITERYLEDGKKKRKVYDKIAFDNLDENLPHTCRGSAASIDADLTTVNDPSNMLSVNRHVLGTSQSKNQDLEMKMALQDLESLELMSDIQSRRRILDIRCVQREFPQRIIIFKENEIIVGESINHIVTK